MHTWTKTFTYESASVLCSCDWRLIELDFCDDGFQHLRQKQLSRQRTIFEYHSGKARGALQFYESPARDAL